MFTRWISAHVRHLEREVEWYRQQMIHERTRAERAVDMLLVMKVPGAVPITPTPAETRDANTVAPDETAEQTAQRLLNDPEFQSAGSTV